MIARATVAGDATVQLNAWTTVATEGTLSYVRALALPLAEFAGFDYERAATIVSTANTTPTTVNMIAPTLPPAPTYQYIATALVEESCPEGVDAERGVHFMMGGTERAFLHATDNCSNELTYGVNRAFTSLPSMFSIGLSSGNGIAVFHRQSTQLVLALP